MPVSLAELTTEFAQNTQAVSASIGGVGIQFCVESVPRTAPPNRLFVRVIEDGDLVQVSTLIKLPAGLDPSNLAIFCLRMCRATTAVQCELQSEDTLRLVADHPVLDARFTPAHLATYLGIVAEARHMVLAGLEGLARGDVEEAFAIALNAKAKWRAVCGPSKPFGDPVLAGCATNQSLSDQLTRLDVENEVVARATAGEHILAILPTASYRSPDGDRSLRAMMRVEPTEIALEVPMGVQSADHKTRAELAKVLMRACGTSEVFQAEIDADGEVYVVAELVTLGMQLTDAQVGRLIESLTGTVDEFAIAIRRVVGDPA